MALTPIAERVNRDVVAEAGDELLHNPPCRFIEGLTALSDQVLPHRHCRGADRGRQAPLLRRHRPDLQISLRPAHAEGVHARARGLPGRIGGSGRHEIHTVLTDCVSACNVSLQNDKGTAFQRDLTFDRSTGAKPPQERATRTRCGRFDCCLTGFLQRDPF